MHNQTYSSLIDAIGNTPLIRLDRYTRAEGVDGTILAKLDYLNPGFSKKDRAAKGIIEAAEKSGALKPGQTVVELTSGNMGTGLAIVCGIKGYTFIAVMSEGNSPERARMMAALGAEVHLVAQAPGATKGEVSGADLELVEREASALTHKLGAFRADQFHHSGNWQSHFEGTGAELLAQSGGNIDGFVDFVGSGGTFAGVSKALKAAKPETRCFIAEPEGAAVLAGQKADEPNHPIQGGGYSMAELSFLKQTPCDGFIQIAGNEATKAARQLAKTEGIFAGFSAGANAAAACQLLRGSMAGQTISIVICDSGLKYLSTDLWA